MTPPSFDQLPVISRRNLALTTAPLVVLLLLLVVGPNLHVTVLSLWHGGFSLTGFRRALNEEFFTAARLTFWYATLTVAGQLFLGVVVASVVDALWRRGRIRWAATLTLVVFAPYTVPSVVVKLMSDLTLRDHGLFAVGGAQFFHIAADSWMGQRLFWTVVLVSVWQFFPFVFMAALATMRLVPAQLYRAAEVDGADLWRKWLHVTWPAMAATVGAAAVLRWALMFTKFDTPYLLAGSTASDQANLLSILVYRKTTTVAPTATLNAAATAIAMMLLLLALLMSGVVISGIGRAIRRQWKAREFPDLMRVFRLYPLWNGVVLAVAMITTVATVLGCLIPFIVLLCASLLPDYPQGVGLAELKAGGWTLQHHVALFQGGFSKYSAYLWNTFQVSVSATLGVVFFSFIAAYGLTRSTNRLLAPLRAISFWAYTLPPIVLTLSYSILLRKLRIYDTLVGLSLANMTLCLPFGLWLMVSYLNQVPRIVDYAAAADGRSWWQSLWSVIGPRLVAGLVTVSVFTFILSWNDVAFSLVLTSDKTHKTLAAGVYQNIFQAEGATTYGEYAAASLYVVILALVILALPISWVERRERRAQSENQ